MTSESKPSVRPKRDSCVVPRHAKGLGKRTAKPSAAKTAYRSKIESLLAESTDSLLVDVWQRLYPFPHDAPYGPADRRGIIEDLADFAEVLRPNLDGMRANRLCRLLEKCAV